MSEIVNNNNLNLILTDYGLNRIAEATSKPSVNITITKIKLGSGDNQEYYEPSPSQTTLKGDLGLEFYIYEKEILEDEVTVSFHTIIPETVGGFDIREVGLYETVDGTDYLFAISTSQPFVKPSPDTFHFIYIDYYMFLKSENLASVYSQIVLDSNYSYISERDIEELTRTFLWSYSNLLNQVGNNSKIIGYDRATQLYEKINKDKEDFSFLNLYQTFSIIENTLSSPSNILAYWIFTNDRRKNVENSIIDLSKNANYLTTSVPLVSLEGSYIGYAPVFTFKPPESFSLSSQIPLDMFDPITLKDYPLTISYAVSPLDPKSNRTIIAKSNYATRAHSFEIMELANSTLRVRFFSDSDNFLTFTSAELPILKEKHAVTLVYDPVNIKMTAFINSTKQTLGITETGNYTHINEIPEILYAFECSPVYNIYTNDPEIPTRFYEDDGTFYAGRTWTIDSNKIYYDGNEASYTPSENVRTDKLFAWKTTSTEFAPQYVYTKTTTISKNTTLYTRNYEVIDQEEGHFKVVPSGENYVIKYNDTYSTVRDASYDVSPVTLYCFQYKESLQMIWANNYEAPQLLYNGDKTCYTGNDWTIEDGFVYYNDYRATYDESNNIQTLSTNLTSYITDASGNHIDFINSDVNMIAIFKEGLPDEKARAFNLELTATLGKNPYLGGI